MKSNFIKYDPTSLNTSNISAMVVRAVQMARRFAQQLLVDFNTVWTGFSKQRQNDWLKEPASNHNVKLSLDKNTSFGGYASKPP